MRRSLLTVPALVGIAALALPGAAAPPKPITKTYTATAAPSGLGLTAYCTGLPTTTDKHFEGFKAPAAGTLKVALSGAVGDWDAFLLDATGEILAESANLGPGDEGYSHKIKKAATFSLLSCNGAGGPTASVTYTFTFAK